MNKILNKFIYIFMLSMVIKVYAMEDSEEQLSSTVNHQLPTVQTKLKGEDLKTRARSGTGGSQTLKTSRVDQKKAKSQIESSSKIGSSSSLNSGNSSQKSNLSNFTIANINELFLTDVYNEKFDSLSQSAKDFIKSKDNNDTEMCQVYTKALHSKAFEMIGRKKDDHTKGCRDKVLAYIDAANTIGFIPEYCAVSKAFIRIKNDLIRQSPEYEAWKNTSNQPILWEKSEEYKNWIKSEGYQKWTALKEYKMWNTLSDGIIGFLQKCEKPKFQSNAEETLKGYLGYIKRKQNNYTFSRNDLSTSMQSQANQTQSEAGFNDEFSVTESEAGFKQEFSFSQSDISRNDLSVNKNNNTSIMSVSQKKMLTPQKEVVEEENTNSLGGSEQKSSDKKPETLAPVIVDINLMEQSKQVQVVEEHLYDSKVLHDKIIEQNTQTQDKSNELSKNLQNINTTINKEHQVNLNKKVVNTKKSLNSYDEILMDNTKKTKETAGDKEITETTACICTIF